MSRLPFRHLPSRPGQAPSELEVRIFEGVRDVLTREDGPLPPLIYVPDVAAVFPSKTRDAEGRLCVGLAIAVKEGAR